jgi:3-oxoacyl-[acyl-carrier protein] reductase
VSGRLSGETALVTGGGSGIGRAIVLAYAHEGAQVAVVDRDEVGAAEVSAEAVELGVRAKAFRCDVSQPQEVVDAVASILATFGRIDVLVNNAGVGTTSPIAEMAVEAWDETIAINLTGAFLVTRAVVPGMIARRHGKVINVSSQLGLRGAPNMVGYCASKAGLLGLTRALGRELIEFGIHVNAITPGPTATPMTAGVPEATLEEIYAELPIRRMATPEEIAPTAVMLATADGAYYVGATLNVSGGHVM